MLSLFNIVGLRVGCTVSNISIIYICFTSGISCVLNQVTAKLHSSEATFKDVQLHFLYYKRSYKFITLSEWYTSCKMTQVSVNQRAKCPLNVKKKRNLNWRITISSQFNFCLLSVLGGLKGTCMFQVAKRVGFNVNTTNLLLGALSDM